MQLYTIPKTKYNKAKTLDIIVLFNYKRDKGLKKIKENLRYKKQKKNVLRFAQ